jgi:bifunctional UDP-N-acetylglucosamine pyrophosphorylase/glucosamine-1-phosphate N-acetyltransferase
MLQHVHHRCMELGADDVYIVYGHGGELLRSQYAGLHADWIEQAQQLGTAHAVLQAAPKLKDDSVALILYADVPLINTHTLSALVNSVSHNHIALLTVQLDDPAGYGRIVRENDNVVAIVEHKDASEQQKKISEVNTGILALNAGYLKLLLSKVDNNNSQGEYYLTDIIALAVQQGNRIITSQPQQSYEVEGVNDRKQLAKLERIHQRELIDAIMEEGVTVADPARVDIRGTLTVGNDSFIDINTVFEGDVVIGSHVSIGSGCIITNSNIASGSHIKPYSILENVTIGENVEVGPFARLRPGTELKANSRVGNFVEVKNTRLGNHSKANHLTYLGDSDIGDYVNIGAGTITCNYDGANKHKTIIKNGAFIGSDTQLVAPVTVGENATIGAGSTITRDTDDNSLTLSRSIQKTIKGWERPKKK